MSDVEPTMKIWIIRRGSGKAQVHPSPVHARPGDTVRIRNLTRDAATVDNFPGLPASALKEGARAAAVPPGGYADFTVGGDRGFFEYDVAFPELAQYAEGNSKPGVIVDP
jgi:hypothetical protein